MKVLIFILLAVVLQIEGAQLLGGWTPVSNVNSSEFSRITNFAAEKVTVELGAAHRLRPMKVENAKKQLVAGMKYNFTMDIGATECKTKENSAADISSCNFLRCGAVRKCNATVWDRPWVKDTRLTYFNCSKETNDC